MCDVLAITLKPQWPAKPQGCSMLEHLIISISHRFWRLNDYLYLPLSQRSKVAGEFQVRQGLCQPPKAQGGRNISRVRGTPRGDPLP